MRRDVFQAIADPVRRDIIKILSDDVLTVTEVAENFEVSRPAISKHLKILKECGVIEMQKQGREQYCRINPQSLIPAFMWMEQFQRLWEARLDSFEEYLNNIQAKNKKND
ncbi:MAG: ArsR family transcriptional regulator [Bacteroidetes bacterium]|nr:MAG: ArsR family transcriptional regulator [Bacteroidota bacterium]